MILLTIFFWVILLMGAPMMLILSGVLFGASKLIPKDYAEKNKIDTSMYKGGKDWSK